MPGKLRHASAEVESEAPKKQYYLAKTKQDQKGISSVQKTSLLSYEATHLSILIIYKIKSNL